MYDMIFITKHHHTFKIYIHDTWSTCKKYNKSINIVSQLNMKSFKKAIKLQFRLVFARAKAPHTEHPAQNFVLLSYLQWYEVYFESW